MRYAEAMNRLRAQLAQAESDRDKALQSRDDEHIRFESYLAAVEAIFGTNRLKELERIALRHGRRRIGPAPPPAQAYRVSAAIEVPEVDHDASDPAECPPRRPELHARDVQELSLTPDPGLATAHMRFLKGGTSPRGAA